MVFNNFNSDAWMQNFWTQKHKISVYTGFLLEVVAGTYFARGDVN